NNVQQVGVRTGDGQWHVFKAAPGEPGLRVGPDQIRQLQDAAGNPQQFNQLTDRFGLKDRQLRGYDAPAQVQVEMNGRRLEYHANGEQTWSTMDGGAMHRFPSAVGDPRAERKVHTEPDGRGGDRLTYFDGAYDRQANQQRKDLFKYDENGNVN